MIEIGTYREGPALTAEDLNREYLDIYDGIYTTKTLQQEEALLRRMRAFSIDLCMYLHGGGLSPKMVTITVGAAPSGVLLHVEFSSRLYLMIKVFRYQYFRTLLLDEASPLFVENLAPALVVYELSESNAYGVLLGAGTASIGSLQLMGRLRRLLGWCGCNTCHYSDDDVEHCGQGMEMLVPNCTKRLEKRKSLWST